MEVTQSPAATTDDDANDDEWTTGNFTLVSADNVTFRVDSFYLYAARCVQLCFLSFSHTFS